MFIVITASHQISKRNIAAKTGNKNESSVEVLQNINTIFQMRFNQDHIKTKLKPTCRINYSMLKYKLKRSDTDLVTSY